MLAGVGIVSLIAGIVALVFQQPWDIWLPPLLVGGILLTVSVGIFPVLRRRYEQLELRKMAAMDGP